MNVSLNPPPDEEGMERRGGDRTTPSGLVALASLARTFGVHLDADRMLRDNRLTTKYLSSSQIMRCAEAAGLRVIGLRPSWMSLTKLSRALPAIVILKGGDAMILTRVDNGSAGQHVFLRDPFDHEANVLTFEKNTFKSIWSGDIILVQPNVITQDSVEDFSLRMLAKLILGERAMLRDIAISALMLSLLALTPILFYRLSTERVIPYRATSTYAVICLLALFFVAFEVAFGVLRRYLLLRLTTRIDVKLLTEMFTRVLNLPADYFERTPAGLTMHKMGQIGRIRKFLVGQLFGTLLDSGILVFFIPLMFFFSPLLTSVVLTFAVLICAWLIIMLPVYKKKSGAVETLEAQRGAFLAQSIQGIRTVKSLAIEKRQIEEWDGITARLARLQFEEGNISNLIQAVVTPLERFMVTGSFGLGVFLALTSNDPTSTTTLFTFMLLSQRLASPLMQVSHLVNQYDEARTAIGVVASLVNQAPEAGRSGDGVRNELQGHVAFSEVLFKYQGAFKPALKNVTFEIPQGTTLGVMGRSGSGKTTITRLIQRLNTEYSGIVKVDGIDVRNFELSHYRSSLGVVLQENFLFSGTIRSNITMAKPEATFNEMVHSARLAGAEEFIEKLPNGYETYVYEGSPNLSGGQRQRLAIARALITDPKILILDEATSALDAESEAIVNANIERISQGRTVITISHRLASLVKADAILVMEQGEVNDIGKHHELLERNEIYANLWYTQNPHTAAPAAPRPQLTYRGSQSVA